MLRKTFVLHILLITFLLISSILASPSVAMEEKLVFHNQNAVGGLTLDTLALSCHTASRYHETNFKLDPQFQILSSFRDPKTGFQAVALEHLSTKKVLFCIGGTQGGKDPFDILADLGIFHIYLKQLKDKTIVLYQAIKDHIASSDNGEDLRHKEAEWYSMLELIRTKTIVRNNNYLHRQVKQAQEFIKSIFEKYEQKHNKSLNLNNMIITGHSLGGFIAQVLGTEYDCIVHTFNAPGAWNFSNSGNHLRIFNHLRKHDCVGRFGWHVGRSIIYPNLKMTLSSLPPVYLGKNHNILLFKDDLTSGITGKEIQEIGTKDEL
jgi:hypothetical protein